MFFPPWIPSLFKEMAGAFMLQLLLAPLVPFRVSTAPGVPHRKEHLLVNTQTGRIGWGERREGSLQRSSEREVRDCTCIPSL